MKTSLSLAPLSANDALGALLQTPPPRPEKKDPKKRAAIDMRLVMGLGIVATGAFHVWARRAVTEFYNATSPSKVLPALRYTPRATALVGIGLTIMGIIILLGF